PGLPGELPRLPAAARGRRAGAGARPAVGLRRGDRGDALGAAVPRGALRYDGGVRRGRALSSRPPRAANHWNEGGDMTKGGRTGLVIVGVLVIGLVGIGLVARTARQPERGSVLEIVLDDPVEEQAPTDPVGQIFGNRRLTQRDYIEAILRARDDHRINGLL